MRLTVRDNLEDSMIMSYVKRLLPKGMEATEDKKTRRD